MPEHPQQKTSLLAVPKRRDQVIAGKFSVGVIISIVIFKVMLRDDYKKCYAYSQYGHGMDVEADHPVPSPSFLPLQV